MAVVRGETAVLCYAVLYCRALGPTGGVQGDVGRKPVGRQARETQRDGGPGLGAVPAGRGIPQPRRLQSPIIGTVSQVSGVVLGLRFREANGTNATQDH